MKTFYENAEMEVVAFECEDIITTSALETKGDLSDFLQPTDGFNGGDLI